MPEPIDAHPGASSAPAPVPPAVPDLESLSETELHAWKMTGALPEKPKEPETPPAAPSAAPAGDPPASPDAPKPPAPEAGAAPRPDPRATENRVPELLADRARERERADRLEKELAELRRQQG